MGAKFGIASRKGAKTQSFIPHPSSFILYLLPFLLLPDAKVAK